MQKNMPDGLPSIISTILLLAFLIVHYFSDPRHSLKTSNIMNIETGIQLLFLALIVFLLFVIIETNWRKMKNSIKEKQVDNKQMLLRFTAIFFSASILIIMIFMALMSS